MTIALHDPTCDLDMSIRMPGWITSARHEAIEEASFLSGAALSHLHNVLARGKVPQALLRTRLALRASEASMIPSGRSERAGELRDAIAFLQPGDLPGPAGAVCLSWQRAVERPVSVKALHRALPQLDSDRIATWLDDGQPRGAGQGAPVPRAAAVLQSVLEDHPRDHAAALILAEAGLARALRWDHIVPLLTLGLKRADLKKTGEEMRLACHRAIGVAAIDAVREAADLTRRATRLREVAPRLRAKGAEAAVALFLARDAVAPTALTSLRSDRAARRFCDRLVDLGVVRELTGRDTFRLYGL